MKKLWISPYTLKIANKSETRDGFLIKLQTGDFKEGYADCFPWINFGDPSVNQLVEWIKPEKSNPLLMRSMHFAALDGQAREEKRKLISDVALRNHYLVTDLTELTNDRVMQMIDSGFTTFKIKVGKDPKAETKSLKNCFSSVFGKVKFRLDFNCRFTSAYREFLDLCDDIEFIEDPTETTEEWADFKEEYNFPVAMDQATKNKLFDVQVIKPAKQSENDYLTQDLVFTSYIDHPVGQACALYQAQQYGEQKRDYGLMSHHIYEPNVFSDYLTSRNNTFTVSGNYGIGFDDLWSRMEWQRMI